MLTILREHLRIWDWRLFAFIVLFLGLPNVYQFYRIYLIGNELPDPGSLAIVSQWQFVALVVEVFQEATVLAIFYFLGSQLRAGKDVQLDRTKSVLTLIFLASLVFSASVFLFRGVFITLIGTDAEIQEQTRAYLGISIFSIPFTLLGAALIVLFESLRLRSLVLVMAFVNVGLRFILDTLFFGGHSCSLEAGVVGVGWSTLLASVGVFIVGLVLLIRVKNVSVADLASRPSFADMREYLRVGLGSGADSLIRNVAYFLMIVRVVNVIGTEEIGGYYIAIQVFWSFMLVPVLAFADSAKALVANATGDLPRIRALWRASMFITAGMMLIWVVLVPMLPTFIDWLADDAKTVDWARTAFGILFVPYVLFSFNTVTDAVFYGTGRTQYLVYQSILTNGTVYLGAFALYAFDIWSPTFQGVMLLFALGILVDSILTMYFVIKLLFVDSMGQPSRNEQMETVRIR